MRQIFFILALLLAIQPDANAQWKHVKNVSVSFRIKNAGINVDGTFRNVSAGISLDEKSPERSSFSGIAKVQSVSTGIALRDRHLREKEEHFNSSRFPDISMRSYSIQSKGNGVFEVSWDLTIKGITKRFTSMVHTLVRNGNLLLNTEFTLNRHHWDLGGNSLTMSDNVHVKINSVMTK